MVNQRMTVLERAFELAKSGKFASVEEIRRALASEGFWVDQLTGRTLRAQLRDIIRAAAKPHGGE